MFKRFKRLISLGLAFTMTTMTFTGCTGGSDAETKISQSGITMTISDPVKVDDKLSYNITLKGSFYTEVSTIKSIKITNAVVKIDSYTYNRSINYSVPITHNDNGTGEGTFDNVVIGGILGDFTTVAKTITVTVYTESNDGEYNQSFTLTGTTAKYNAEISAVPSQMKYIITKEAQSVIVPVSVYYDDLTPVSGKTLNWAFDNGEMVTISSGIVAVNNGQATIILSVNENTTNDIRNGTLTITSPDLTNSVTVDVQQNSEIINTYNVTLNSESVIIDNEAQSVNNIIRVTDEVDNPQPNTIVHYIINMPDVATPEKGTLTTDNSGVALLTVNVSKNDSLNNRTFTYTIYTSTDAKTFTIEQKGQLYTVEVIGDTDITLDENAQSFNVNAVVKDIDGNPVSGVEVTMVSDNVDFIAPTNVTDVSDSNGLVEFHFDIMANDSNYDRVATLALMTSNGYSTVKVTQQASTPVTTVLSITPSDVTVGPDAGTINVVAQLVDQNGDPISGGTISWAVVYDPDNTDIITPVNGNVTTDSDGRAVLNLHITANSSTEARTATVNIYSGDDQATFTVDQDGVPQTN